MNELRDQKFNVSSIGMIYRKTLSLFAHHFEDEDGRPIRLRQLTLGQRFFVVFESGTGLTRASAIRVA